MEYAYPLFWYDLLAYKFPLNITQPVVRIPIAGPKPFNTLAIIRAGVPGFWEWATGDLYRHTVSVPTPLFLRDYDPLRPEQQQIRHSSAGSITMIQIVAGDPPHIGDWNTDITVAFDGFRPETSISPTGQVILTADTADQCDGRIAGFGLDITSWILCWEPPIPGWEAPPPTYKEFIDTAIIDPGSNIDDWLRDG